ncbi:ATP-binding protein [Dyadobacter sp. CY261]|uniref:sensor histidine kinase n=1 Tax=Dyadobacter sp. CY261 TaxID=2907203 RepID=UPI001F48404E|nr:HAMP domain-containing sensor histidine kinase [Dyadobacter sp. CY261]MCF0071058.1 ATP-binding protein [Dyadobacter sp. CY261]
MSRSSQGGLPEQSQEFFNGIFSTAEWPARWYCGYWSDFHGWLYIVSDILIWAAYFLIPVFLVRFVLRRKDFPFPKTIWLFVAFILFCGATHLIDALIFWLPIYRFSALVRFGTAIVSLTTVYCLFKIFPNVLLLRSVADLQREIDERTIVEEKLAESEFLLTAAGNVGKLGGWEYDPATGQFRWTATCGNIFETDEADVHSETDLLKLFPEPYQLIIRAALRESIQFGQAWDHELQLVTPAGTRKWVRFSATPLLNAAGQVSKVGGIIMDIDRYKTLEIDLVRSIDQMAQKNNQLHSFTHILSHNLRNHSSNIALLSEFVDETTLTKDNEELFQKIKTVAKHLNGTLDDLSQVIKIRDNQLEGEKLDIREVTDQVLSVLDESLHKSQAHIDLEFEEKEIVFPHIYLESILMNLISNGIKYKKDDQHPMIKLHFYRNKVGLKVLEYCDKGRGIDLSLHAEKIFGLYKTFHKHEDAHGVGLFLIKNQIEAQGGSIQVFSKVDAGITFKITFNENA